MIELAAVIGIIAGWVFRMAYSPAKKSIYENFYRERIKTIQDLRKEIEDLTIRLEVQKAFAKGLNGLPYGK